MSAAVLVPGVRVRCSYRGEHIGRVLAIDSVKAWTGALAFGTRRPKARAVRAHVESVLATVPSFASKVPIEYSFGVRWDSIAALAPVEGQRTCTK